MSSSLEGDSIASKKLRLTLNLNAGRNAINPLTSCSHNSKNYTTRKAAFFLPHQNQQDDGRPSPVFLTSPDLMMFTVPTPEVERMILQGLIGPKTPSPSALFVAATKTPNTLAEERELYTRGFTDAMAYSSSLHAAAALPVNLARMAPPPFLNSGLALMDASGGGMAYPPPHSTANLNYPVFGGIGGPYGGVMHHSGVHQHRPALSPVQTGFKILPLPQLTLIRSPTEEMAASAFVPRSTGPFISLESSSSAPSSPSASLSSSSDISVCDHAQTVPSPCSSFSSGHRTATSSVMTYNEPLAGVSDALMDVDANCKERNDVRRERNRVAAARCRQRKVNKINVLEGRVDNLKEQNAALNTQAEHLRQVLFRLKRELAHHLDSGCDVHSIQEILRSTHQPALPQDEPQ